MNSGSSVRINFRANDEVYGILKEVEDKSRFIRDAIVFYWERKDFFSPKKDTESSSTVTKDKVDTSHSSIVIEDEVIDESEEEIYNGRWSPPWKSS